jgi:hypothetical protein
MDDNSRLILKMAGFDIDELKDIDGLITPRESLISDDKYDEIKKLIPELKKHYSSSFMTSLQTKAETSQKWPLLNLIRQLLNVYKYKMEPIRKSDGYTLEGVKKYKRYFQIKKRTPTIKKIELNDVEDLNDIIIKSDDAGDPS